MATHERGRPAFVPRDWRERFSPIQAFILLLGAILGYLIVVTLVAR